MDLFELIGFESNEEEKKSEEKKTPVKKKGVKKTTTKSSTNKKVKLPIRVIGTGIRRELLDTQFKGNDEVELSDIVNYLYTLYPYIKDACQVIYDEKSQMLVVCDERDKAVEKVDISLESLVGVIVGVGDARVQFTNADFGSDNVSSAEIISRWIENYPEYSDCKVVYCEKEHFLYPILNNYVESGQNIKLPVKIGDIGYETKYTCHDFEDEPAEVTVKEIINRYEEDNCSIHYEACELLYAFNAEVNHIVPMFSKKNVGKVATVQYIKLPVKVCVCHTSAGFIEFTPEDFGGKESVTMDDVKNELQKIYKIYKQKRCDFIYIEQDNAIVTHIYNSTKGAADFFKSEEELNEKITNSEFFIGFIEKVFMGQRRIARVEKNLIGTFISAKETFKRHGMYRTIIEEEEDVLKEFNFLLPRIPVSFLYDTIVYFRKDLKNEAMVQIYYNKKNKEYFIYKPKIRHVGKGYIEVERNLELDESTDFVLVLDIHSHNTMGAFFSTIDNEDELETRLFGVIGCLDKEQVSLKFRAGANGCFKDLEVKDIFEIV